MLVHADRVENVGLRFGLRLSPTPHPPALMEVKTTWRDTRSATVRLVDTLALFFMKSEKSEMYMYNVEPILSFNLLCHRV